MGIKEYDQEIYNLAQDVDLLQAVKWPKSVVQEFLENVHKGNPKLPEVEYYTQTYSDQILRLRQISKDLNPGDPMSGYLKRTADSYRLAFQLLERLGTKDVTTLSEEVYGLPIDKVTASLSSNLKAAQYFLKICDEYQDSPISEDHEYVTALELKDELLRKMKAVFNASEITVHLDDELTAKAKTSSNLISLRSDAKFTRYDADQLVHHEIFVHALTSLNGRAQEKLKCFSLDAPRTTEDQEGLATFAERISGSIDISRMKRIALRVIAIDKALSGADFIEVFQFFLDSGQSEIESVNSAIRVFRGVPLTGGHAFTKDVVYLKGLIKVHSFFRWALKNHKLHVAQLFFSGRMTVTDAIELEPLMESGEILGPKYLPPWMQKIDGLAANLAFSVFANRIRVKELTEDFDFEAPLDVED